MNKLQRTLETILCVITTIQEIAQNKEVDFSHLSSRFRSPSSSRSSENSRPRYRYRDREVSLNWTQWGSRYTVLHERRRKSRSLHCCSFRSNRYLSFSRSNSGKEQFFKITNSSYRLPTRPRSRSASASRRFVNKRQPISFENDDHWKLFTIEKQIWI